MINREFIRLTISHLPLQNIFSLFSFRFSLKIVPSYPNFKI